MAAEAFADSNSTSTTKGGTVVNDAAQLKIAICYHAEKNQYSVLFHNLTGEQAAEVEKGRSDVLPVLIVEQQKRHSTEDAQNCRACRNDVKRSSGLNSTPKFKRRK
jgi:hypothetical protein